MVATSDIAVRFVVNTDACDRKLAEIERRIGALVESVAQLREVAGDGEDEG